MAGDLSVPTGSLPPALVQSTKEASSTKKSIDSTHSLQGRNAQVIARDHTKLIQAICFVAFLILMTGLGGGVGFTIAMSISASVLKITLVGAGAFAGITLIGRKVYIEWCRTHPSETEKIMPEKNDPILNLTKRITELMEEFTQKMKKLEDEQESKTEAEQKRARPGINSFIDYEIAKLSKEIATSLIFGLRYCHSKSQIDSYLNQTIRKFGEEAAELCSKNDSTLKKDAVLDAASENLKKDAVLNAALEELKQLINNPKLNATTKHVIIAFLGFLEKNQSLLSAVASGSLKMTPKTSAKVIFFERESPSIAASAGVRVLAAISTALVKQLARDLR